MWPKKPTVYGGIIPVATVGEGVAMIPSDALTTSGRNNPGTWIMASERVGIRMMKIARIQYQGNLDMPEEEH